MRRPFVPDGVLGPVHGRLERRLRTIAEDHRHLLHLLPVAGNNNNDENVDYSFQRHKDMLLVVAQYATLDCLCIHVILF